MVIKNDSFVKLKEEIVQGKKKIVVFGAGVLGAVTTASILWDLGLFTYLDCYVDNDIFRQKEGVMVGNGRVAVCDESYLLSVNGEETVLIIAVSRCVQILEKLDSYRNLERSSCYLMPMMCISNFREQQWSSEASRTEKERIPKKIHYVWLGGKKLPRHLEKCIDSWKRFCPDYELIRWDESNYDLDKNAYTREAYRERAFGFVPDYMRLDLLYRYGGIYLDTDVEIIRPLDDLLSLSAFCGVEKWQTLNFGGCSGALRGNLAIKYFLQAREEEHFVCEDGHLNKRTCGYLDTMTAIKLGYKLNGKKQTFLGMTIFPSDFFHPYDYMSGRLQTTANTYSIHHFNGGWLSPELREENRKISEIYTALERRAASAEAFKFKGR